MGTDTEAMGTEAVTGAAMEAEMAGATVAEATDLWSRQSANRTRSAYDRPT